MPPSLRGRGRSGRRRISRPPASATFEGLDPRRQPARVSRRRQPQRRQHRRRARRRRRAGGAEEAERVGRAPADIASASPPRRPRAPGGGRRPAPAAGRNASATVGVAVSPSRSDTSRSATTASSCIRSSVAIRPVVATMHPRRASRPNASALGAVSSITSTGGRARPAPGARPSTRFSSRASARGSAGRVGPSSRGHPLLRRPHVAGRRRGTSRRRRRWIATGGPSHQATQTTAPPRPRPLPARSRPSTPASGDRGRAPHRGSTASEGMTVTGDMVSTSVPARAARRPVRSRVTSSCVGSAPGTRRPGAPCRTRPRAPTRWPPGGAQGPHRVSTTARAPRPARRRPRAAPAGRRRPAGATARYPVRSLTPRPARRPPSPRAAPHRTTRRRATVRRRRPPRAAGGPSRRRRPCPTRSPAGRPPSPRAAHGSAGPSPATQSRTAGGSRRQRLEQHGRGPCAARGGR